MKDRNPTAKFEPKSDEGIFLGYSSNSRAYRVYKKVTKSIMESENVVVDDQPGLFEIPRSRLEYSTNNSESPTNNPKSSANNPDSPDSAQEPSIPEPGTT